MVKKLLRLICFVLIFSFVFYPVSAKQKQFSNDEIIKVIKDLFEYQSKHTDKSTANNMADWYYLCSARCGNKENYSKYATLLSKSKFGNATDYHRVALCLSSMGENLENFNGQNLIAKGIYNNQDIAEQGINSVSYGLLALDSKKYSVPKNAKYNRKKLVKQILSYQNADGGFSLNGANSEIDATAFALQALAPYKSAENNKEKAFAYLSKSQNADGGFGSAESISQVIIALCACKIDFQNDKRFIKNENTLISNLMKYKNSNSGFKHILNQKKSDNLASSQALCALIAFYRYKNNYNSFYDFLDGIKIIFKNEKRNQKINFVYYFLTICFIIVIMFILKKGVFKK